MVNPFSEKHMMGKSNPIVHHFSWLNPAFSPFLMVNHLSSGS
jgi:hypothetical protein